MKHFTLAVLASCVAVAAFSSRVYAQSGRIEISAGYPLPESSRTFSDLYDGQLHARAAYSHPIGRRLRLGVGSEYSKFRAEVFVVQPVILIDMHVVTASIHAAYTAPLSDELDVEGMLRTGWAWMFYRLDEPAVAVINADESSPLVVPGVYLKYEVSTRVAIRSGVSYSVIFEHFQDDQAIEDSTIRYLAVTTGVAVTI